MMYGYSGNFSWNKQLPSSSAANPTTAYPLLHTVMIPLQCLHPPPPPPPFGGGAGTDERWSIQETKDMIGMRAELECGITTKKDMSLWEIVADGMREKAYKRTADQCRSKWNNLVDGYKAFNTQGKESNMDNIGPFFKELHAVFTARAKRMKQSLVEVDENGVMKGVAWLKKPSEDYSDEEFTEEEEDEEEIEVDRSAGKGRVIPQQKAGREKRQKIRENNDTNVNKNDSTLNKIEDILRNLAQQQQKIDMEWKEAMEKRAEERERFENEWWLKMESLEKEKLMMEKDWREREEVRKLREEKRAEQMDVLLTLLLNKLIDRGESS